MLRIDEVVVDAGTQVREDISEQVVEDYAESLGEGAVFPPVVAFSDGSSYWLADGFHRLRAFRRAGREEIEADVYAGSLDDALWFALGANRAHGARLSRADKRHAIELAFRTWPVLSQGRVARHVGCTQQYVSKIREQVTTSCDLPDRVLGRDGKLYSARRPASVPPVSSDSGSGGSFSDSASETVPAPVSDASGPEAVGASDPAVPEVADGTAGQRPGSASALAADEPEPSLGVSSRLSSGKQPSQRSQDRSNRLLSSVAFEAKQLLAQKHLIAFAALDRSMLSTWIDDLDRGRRDLVWLIRELKKEVGGGEARPVSGVGDSSDPA